MCKTNRMRRTLVCVPLVLGAMTNTCMAASIGIGPDCRPIGLLPRVHAWWNPEEFWTSELTEITSVVENQRKLYQMYLLDKQQQVVDAQYDEARSRLVGVEQVKPNVAAAKATQEVNAIVNDTQAALLQSAVEWGERCAAYAHARIAETQRK